MLFSQSTRLEQNVSRMGSLGDVAEGLPRRERGRAHLARGTSARQDRQPPGMTLHSFTITLYHYHSRSHQR